MNYPWPGNVRELEHVMEHAFVLCHGPVITLEHLPLEIRDDVTTGGVEKSVRISVQESQPQEPSGSQEVLNALNKAHWNKTKAARLLGISRRTVHRKINRYQLSNEE
jgi:transcriptional regulator of acetoin/glycerol metabolism